MPFATEAEQIRKFENDEVAQHYFEVLRLSYAKMPVLLPAFFMEKTCVYLSSSIQTPASLGGGISGTVVKTGDGTLSLSRDAFNASAGGTLVVESIRRPAFLLQAASR